MSRGLWLADTDIAEALGGGERGGGVCLAHHECSPARNLRKPGSLCLGAATRELVKLVSRHRRSSDKAMRCNARQSNSSEEIFAGTKI